VGKIYLLRINKTNILRRCLFNEKRLKMVCAISEVYTSDKLTHRIGKCDKSELGFRCVIWHWYAITAVDHFYKNLLMTV